MLSNTSAWLQPPKFDCCLSRRARGLELICTEFDTYAGAARALPAERLQRRRKGAQQVPVWAERLPRAA